MINPKKINDLVQSVINSLPEGIRNLPQDIESNLRAGLQTTLQKMDLVTREEFDVQTSVLLKTRKKLETLEIQVAELEKQLSEKKTK